MGDDVTKLKKNIEAIKKVMGKGGANDIKPVTKSGATTDKK